MVCFFMYLVLYFPVHLFYSFFAFDLKVFLSANSGYMQIAEFRLCMFVETTLHIQLMWQ